MPCVPLSSTRFVAYWPGIVAAAVLAIAGTSAAAGPPPAAPGTPGCQGRDTAGFAQDWKTFGFEPAGVAPLARFYGGTNPTDWLQARGTQTARRRNRSSPKYRSHEGRAKARPSNVTTSFPILSPRGVTSIRPASSAGSRNQPYEATTCSSSARASKTTTSSSGGCCS
jgi:hypothetical protein